MSGIADLSGSKYLGNGGQHQPAVYPASSSDYTGSIFETFETETWDPTKINPDPTYMDGAGLSEEATSGNSSNQISELKSSSLQI